MVVKSQLLHWCFSRYVPTLEEQLFYGSEAIGWVKTKFKFGCPYVANRRKVTSHDHGQFGIRTNLRNWLATLVSSSQTRNHGRESDRKNGNETHQFLIVSLLLKLLCCSTKFPHSKLLTILHSSEWQAGI